MLQEVKTRKPREIVTEDVNYFESARGMLARPKRKGHYPGVIMIHEYWGLNDAIKESARKLAAEGYVILAVDLFGGQVTQDPDRAMKLVQAVNQAEAIKNLKTAVKYLREHEKVQRVAVLGWCFGGGQVMLLSVSGEKLNGTIIYYGNLVLAAKALKKISWPVLGVFGDQDQIVPISKVKEFEAILNMQGIENEVYVYQGVGHAFANPSNPKYAPWETEDAWKKTLAFLSRNLKHYHKVKIKVK